LKGKEVRAETPVQHCGNTELEELTLAGVITDRDAAGCDIALLRSVRDVAEGDAAGQGIAHFHRSRHRCKVMVSATEYWERYMNESEKAAGSYEIVGNC
jgi:hypothetical protein